jgi:hypothetical protein
MAENSGADFRPLSPIEQLTPQEATAELARLTAEHNKQAPVTANPTNALEAYALKQAIINDPDARSKALNGNGPVTRQLKALDEQIANGSPADFAMSGIVPDGHIEPPKAVPHCAIRSAQFLICAIRV